MKNESDDFGHPSEVFFSFFISFFFRKNPLHLLISFFFKGVLDSRLAQAERLEMKDLEEVVQGRTILEKIREAQKELGESMK